MTKAPGANPAPDIDDTDLWRFNEGTHDGLAHVLGARLDTTGCTFRVWAPAARSVSVIGDFNDWDPDAALLVGSDAGIWGGSIVGATRGQRYKYHIIGPDGSAHEKADPVGFAAEEPPATASKIWTLDYEWGDADWMASRAARNAHDAPISVYEVHLGSWRYEPGGYRALAQHLADHLDRMGCTHVELLPVMAHPFYGSWGVQSPG